jgi:hypothetical protein
MFDVADVDAGMCQLHVTAKNFSTSKKVLVVY